MTAGLVGIIGKPPKVTITERDPTLYGPDAARHQREQAKYAAMWMHDEYRAVAPGEGEAMNFLAQAQPNKGADVIDFGAGTGRGAMMLALLGGVRVHMLDFAENCLDAEVRQALETQAHALQFTRHNLVKPVPVRAKYGYCTDVMEHIPPEDVGRVLDNILGAAQHVYFAISCVDDVCGKLIGEPLHLSVHDYQWWLARFRERDCVIHWSEDRGDSCAFYVTAWQDAQEIVKAGVLNVDREQVRANVRANITAGYGQVEPHVGNNVEVLILGGGPSLNAHVDEIKARQAAGAKVVTLNGAYQWALDHGIAPVTQVMVDARAFNARFTRPPREDCLYLMASQCDPAAFEGLPKDRTLLWHTSAEDMRDLLDELYDGKPWFGIPGGSTVLLRAIPLLRMLGFRRFHLYGCDSCLDGGAHHAYAQPENDGPVAIPVTCGDRMFWCHPWMAAQAQEFIDLIRVMGETFEIAVYGDGLLAHVLETGAAVEVDESGDGASGILARNDGE